MSIDRRQFLIRTATLSASATVGGLFAFEGPAGAFPAGGYGPLVTDPNGIVDLPTGFTYKVLANSSNIATPGGTIAATQLGIRVPAENAGPVPTNQDGMGNVYDATTGHTYLVLNHEITTSSNPVPTTFRSTPVPTWDAGGGADGGCTTLVLDANMDVIEHVPSIAGTIRNCAGGPTPWGTWLTCEEDVSASNGSTRLKNHGYLFEVDPIAGAASSAYIPMGRASHEAVCIDPATSVAYITEDATGSVFFKYVPTDTSKQYGSLGNGGALFAMKVPGKPNFADFNVVGETVGGITWAGPIANPDQANLRSAFFTLDNGVIRGNKMEGCWWIDGAAWFVSSYSSAVAGKSHDGQVFKYDPVANTLQLVARIPAGGTTVQLTDGVTTQNHLILAPDNIAATPYGGAIWSQDGGSNQYLVCVDPTGAFFPLARNPSGGEWAGAHFSHDGTWLFANMQTRAITIAITGPWVDEPPVVVPEAPTAILLPLTGAAAFAGALAWRQRRVHAVGQA